MGNGIVKGLIRASEGASTLAMQLPTRRPLTAWILIVLAASSWVSASEFRWAQFRGPGALGVQDGKGIPDTWGTNRNVAWTTEIPGYGWSSPIVWDDRIFVTSVVKDGSVETPRKGLYFGGERPVPSQESHHWMVFCLDRTTGRKLWEKEVHHGAPAGSLHLKNTYASETPVTDGERVYAYFGNLGLFCLSFDGTELWSKRFGAFKIRNGWGTAASPVLHGDRIYIVNDNEEKSFLVALDKRTGEEAWRWDRAEKSNWATPYVWENSLRTEIITPGRQRVRSHDLNGKLLWEFGGMSSIVIPTPFSKFGLLYVASGYVGDKLRPVFAIRPGASGDISLSDSETNSTFIAWCHKTAAPYNPSPLVYGEHFYVLFDFGFLSCHDAKSGREIYGKQRINTEGTSGFTASPWAHNGKIYCLSEDGDTFVIQAGPEYRLLHKNSLEELCMATPAIAGDNLIIRTATRLYSIRSAGESR